MEEEYSSLDLNADIMITSIVHSIVCFVIYILTQQYLGLLYLLVISCWVCPGGCWWGDVIHYPEYVKSVEDHPALR